MKKNRILAAVTATLLCMPATSSIFAAGHQQHTWNQGVWTWRSNTSAYVTLTCTEDGAKQLSAGKITVSQQPATCTEPGKTIYTASTLFDGKTYTDSREVVTSQATGHNWKVSGWTWSDDNTQATVTVTCQNNTSEVRTLNAEIRSDVVDEPTCVDEGKTMYTATAKDPETGKSYVTFKNVTTPVNPDGHAFEAGTGTWKWNDDDSKAQYIATCLLCDKEVPFDATITQTVTKEPTCTEAGEANLKATAILDAADPEDTTVQDETTGTIKALGHDWQKPTFTWNADKIKATATFVCARDKSHTKVVDAVVTSKVTKEPTASTTGEKVIMATATFDGKTYTDDQTIPLAKKTVSAKQTKVKTDSVDTGIHAWTGVYASAAAVSAGLFLTVRKREK
ncbi:hypothetical protein [Absicoccus intestinalis]|uniref:Ig-like domain-containing protein n=2 Tax=Absicoccus TaxID=2718525 RepID=A0ABU4WMT7_9FIRM|nr:hypothetical protein [Absicoccus sp. CLA-KB-P134]MDX8417088.1 hypothetical protein [Absicoccus sp. CLA-KB-P134]